MAAKFTMPTRLVLIEWLDAMSDDAGWKPWKRVAKQEPVLVHSVGYVVSDVPAFMTLAGSVVAIDGTCDGDVTIPLPVECRGLCIDVTTDADNCGGCGLKCDGSCEHGSCVRHCPLGRADCDGNPDCEVNTLSDPQNCGGCGVVCNAIKGQACVRGQCVVAPCDDGDGGLAR